MTTLNIYVADLAAYNAGHLHGQWIDLEEHLYDPELVHETIQKILTSSPVPHGEEFAIHDSEGFAGSISEYTSIEEVCELAGFISEHEDAARASLALGGDLAEARERVENGYQAVESLAEFAQEYLGDMGIELPSFIHVDWESTGRELAMDMSEVRYGGVLYLFGP